jgi:broad specificity phosphatase PhoE
MSRWQDTCCGWVIRHGESTGNALGLVQGQSCDEPLTARGRAQAGRMARLFPRGVHPRIVSSDLRRARETAAAFGDRTGAEVEILPALRERALGVFEGQEWERVDPALTGVRDGVVVDPDAAPDGGESIRQFVDRVTAALRPFASTHGGGTPVVVVAHGGVARVVAAIPARTGDPLAGMGWPAIGNTQPQRCCFAELESRMGSDLSWPTR